MTDDGRTSVVFVLIFILGILQYLLNTAIKLLDYLERQTPLISEVKVMRWMLTIGNLQGNHTTSRLITNLLKIGVAYIH